MKKVTKPKVRPLVTGEKFNAKQMEAKAGDLLPRHTASIIEHQITAIKDFRVIHVMTNDIVFDFLD